MGQYRPIYKRIWKDPDFQKLDVPDKLFFIYLCTNESTTESGIYPITPRTIANETGVDLAKVEDSLNNGHIKNVKYDNANSLIFVKRLRRYNTGGNPDLVRKSILGDYNLTCYSSLWSEFLREYPEYEELLPNPLPTVEQPLANRLPTMQKSAVLTERNVTERNDDIYSNPKNKGVLHNKVITISKLGDSPEMHQFIVELINEFPELDMQSELRQFSLYWSEGKRKLQRPKAALRNWCLKAMEYRKTKSNNKKIGSLPTEKELEDDLKKYQKGEK